MQQPPRQRLRSNAVLVPYFWMVGKQEVIPFVVVDFRVDRY